MENIITELQQITPFYWTFGILMLIRLIWVCGNRRDAKLGAENFGLCLGLIAATIFLVDLYHTVPSGQGLTVELFCVSMAFLVVGTFYGCWGAMIRRNYERGVIIT